MKEPYYNDSLVETDMDLPESGIPMSRKEFSLIPDFPTQRDTEEHQKNAKHLRKYEPSHLEVKYMECMNDITNPETGEVYPKGSLHKADGHTRVLNWNLGDCDKIPSMLSVTKYRVYTWEEMKRYYDNCDSAAAVENSKDKLYGALKLHKVLIDDPKLKAASPIGYAAYVYNKEEHPKHSGLNLDQMHSAVKDFHSQYKVIQEYLCSGKNKLCKKNGKGIKFDFSPSLVAACLLSLKYFQVDCDLLESREVGDVLYDNAKKLVDFWIEINNGEKNTITKGGRVWEPLDHIVNEFDSNATVLKTDAYGYPSLNAGECKKVMSFVLYWVEQHMLDKSHQNLPKSSVWTKYADTFQSRLDMNWAGVYNPTSIERILNETKTNLKVVK